MSRSYQKFSSWPSSEYIPLLWSTLRIKERTCIYKEIRNEEYGDIVFPKPYNVDSFSWSPHHRYYYSLKNIRDDYSTEIRNILNGYNDDRKDFEALFLECYTQIRNHDSGNLSLCFEWLNTKEAKKAIKEWKGEPLEVLSYLNHHRIIEKAVQREHRRMVRK